MNIKSYVRVNQYSKQRHMNILHVIIPLCIFLGGLQLLKQIPQLREDPLKHMNEKTVTLLEELVQTKYFRIIRLNINQECSLGMMKRMCKSKSCTVCRCNDKDIPEFWLNTQKVPTHTDKQDLWGIQRGNGRNGWVWHVEDEANDRGEYFDIHYNIQSFTNYNGSYIWKLIYQENCFKGPDLFDQMCLEEKILYNIISGLHTSISTHLSRFYKNTGEQSAWADLRKGIEDNQFFFNHKEYKRRVLDHPDRIKNLIFLYKVLGKAIVTAAPYLRNDLAVRSDNITEDMKAKGSLIQLLKRLEALDFTSEEKEALKFFKQNNTHVKQYQKYIHNISEILNCVQCQKCRVFGKMQTYGIGTALKILLGYPTPYKRNEIVALFNVFNKISMSVNTYYQHRQQIIEIGHQQPRQFYMKAYKFFGGLCLIFVVWLKYRQEFVLPEYSKQESPEDKGRVKYD